MLAVCAPAPVTRLPSSASGACFAGLHSPWSPPFAPLAPPQLPPPQTAPQGAPLCSPASQLLWRSPTSHARASSATAPRPPHADRRTPPQSLAKHRQTREPPGSETAPFHL